MNTIMKTLEEFVALFSEQFDETDASEIQASTVFSRPRRMVINHRLSLIAMVDDEFDVALKGDDVRTSVTVEDLYNKVIAKL
jgi:acyl carrier protein